MWEAVEINSRLNVHGEAQHVELVCISETLCLCPQTWLLSSPCCWPALTAAVTPGSTCASLDTSSSTWRRSSSAAASTRWWRAAAIDGASTSASPAPASWRTPAARGAWRTRAARGAARVRPPPSSDQCELSKSSCALPSTCHDLLCVSPAALI